MRLGGIFFLLTTVLGTAGLEATARNPMALRAVPAAGDARDPFSVPFPQQVGNARFAPMQPSPPKKITATNTNRLYPTSSVEVATTFLPPPTIEVTHTQPPTHSVSSHPVEVRNTSQAP